MRHGSEWNSPDFFQPSGNGGEIRVRGQNQIRTVTQCVRNQLPGEGCRPQMLRPATGAPDFFDLGHQWFREPTIIFGKDK
jgi:hypothetical protein